MRKMLSILVLAAMAASGSVVHAQSQQTSSTPGGAPQEFEVASVKPQKNARPVDAITLSFLTRVGQSSRNGRFDLAGAPLSVLIQLAYNVKDVQVTGGPSWASSDAYDVTARAEGNATFEQMRPMLRSLLADRFKLKIRQETRELPVYELAPAKGGIKVRVTREDNCVAPDPDNHPPPRNPPGPLNTCGGVRRQMMSGAPERKDRIEALQISMPELVRILSDDVGRTVIDKTGFKGTFDLHMEFTPDEALTNGSGSGPSLFTALTDQLGLRMVSAKAPVEMLVIEDAQRPSQK
jgi:uncharacterized protein (TIGR03435 family)